jgi:hypothetical protein
MRMISCDRIARTVVLMAVYGRLMQIVAEGIFYSAVRFDWGNVRKM